VRWRALAVAVSGLAVVGLASCDFGFGGALDEFCTHPGRCAATDASGLQVEISQGSSREVTITGIHLAGADVKLDPPDIGTVAVLDAGSDEVTARLTIRHGVDAGMTFKLRLEWVREVDHEYSDPFVVTPIVVADGGNDDAGEGTYVRPFKTLARASQQSAAGDIIHLRPGRYDPIFPELTTPCDDAGVGLKPGVTVEGEGALTTFIDGLATRTGTCGFNLYSGDQVVQRLSITGFPEGIRASGAGRPRVIDVSIYDGGIGVAATPGSSLLLQRVSVQGAGRGLVLDGADVMIQEGEVIGSYRVGVSMIGNGGTLAIDGTKIERNGGNSSLDPLDHIGLLVAADAGFAFVDGGSFVDNGSSVTTSTGITVAGSSNTVAVDKSFLRSGLPGGIGLAVQLNSNASVYLADTRFVDSTWGIKVENFLVFNGGKADAGWADAGGGRSVRIGGNDLQDRALGFPTGGNIWDARTGGAGRPVMTLARTKLDGGWPPPPFTVSDSFPDYGIRVDFSPGGSVSFE